MEALEQEQRAGWQGGPSDEDVVARIRKGEALLFEVLMRRHNARVYRAVRSILRAEEDAEDAMQQAYVNAYVHLEQFNGTSKFSTWLLRIAIHEALARKRKNARVVPLTPEIAEALEESAPQSNSPETAAMNHELVHIVETVIDGLPESYRTVFMLRQTEGLDTAETAACLGVSEDVVKQRLHRAKQAIQERLMSQLDDVSRDAFPFHAPRCDRVVSSVMHQLGIR